MGMRQDAVPPPADQPRSIAWAGVRFVTRRPASVGTMRACPTLAPAATE
jgi:hypothetical protein